MMWISLLWVLSCIALSLHKAERACLTSTGRGTEQTQEWARWRQRWQRRWPARDYSRGPSSLGALQKTQQKEGEIRSACHCKYLIKHAEKSQLINSLNCYAFFRILRTPVLTVSVPYKAFLNWKRINCLACNRSLEGNERRLCGILDDWCNCSFVKWQS